MMPAVMLASSNSRELRDRHTWFVGLILRCTLSNQKSCGFARIQSGF